MSDPKVSLGEVAAPGCTAIAREGSEPLRGQTAPRPAVIQYDCHGCRVLVASGSCDMTSIKLLAVALRTAAREYSKVVLEASGITFAGSTFLNLLVLTRRSTDLRVAAPTPQVQRLLEITEIDTILKVRATVDEAATC
ncbi:STAS domain-containing protein [Streptomyces sp. NPDC001935]